MFTGPNIITDGLVLYLDAANTKSYPGTGTTWTDLSGNGNNGTLINGVGYNSGNMGSLVFDGVNDKVTFSYKVSGGERSFFVWVKYTSLDHPTSFQLMGTQEVNAYTYIGIQNGGGIYYFAGTTGGNVGNNVLVNTWVNLGFSINSNGFRIIYKNSVNIHSNTGSIGVASSNPFTIGTVNDNHWVNGVVSQVSIYNKALTAQEVQQNFNATKGRYSL